MDLYDIADQAAAQYGVPTDLFEQQIQQESSFNPNAQNGSATGIAQFMPGTANELGIDPSDPTQALYGAAEYDAQLYDQSGSWLSALTSYGTLPSDSNSYTPSQSSLAATATNADTSSGSGNSFWNFINEPIGSLIGGSTGSALNSLTESSSSGAPGTATGSPSTISQFSNLLGDLTSGSTWQRAGLIVLGLIFIAGAIYAYRSIPAQYVKSQLKV